MHMLDGKAFGYRVNLDIGQVSSQTNVYPISDLSCIAIHSRVSIQQQCTKYVI